MARARYVAVLASIAVALTGTLAGCTQVEESETTYEASKHEEIAGSDIPRVTFTAEAAKRADVHTVPVREIGHHRVIPYAAIIYDDAGKTYAFVSAKPLEYLRTPIKVARIAGDEVQLAGGLALGTEVVTTGAAEVYSAESEVEE
jgi:hypothetical protein